MDAVGRARRHDVRLVPVDGEEGVNAKFWVVTEGLAWTPSACGGHVLIGTGLVRTAKAFTVSTNKTAAAE